MIFFYFCGIWNKLNVFIVAHFGTIFSVTYSNEIILSAFFGNFLHDLEITVIASKVSSNAGEACLQPFKEFHY